MSNGRPPSGGQNGQQQNGGPSSRLTLANVFTAMSGIFVGLVLYTFSVATPQGRDTLIGLAIVLVCCIGMMAFVLRLPVLRSVWSSFRRTFLKKKEAAFERYLWLSFLVGVGVYWLLIGIRALGS